MEGRKEERKKEGRKKERKKGCKKRYAWRDMMIGFKDLSWSTYESNCDRGTF